jgi:hypothetical protein
MLFIQCLRRATNDRGMGRELNTNWHLEAFVGAFYMQFWAAYMTAWCKMFSVQF